MPESEYHEQRDLAYYLKVLRERAWIVALAVVLVVGAGLTISYRSTPLFQASSRLVYQTNSLDRTLFGAQVFADTNQPRSLETAAQLLTVQQVAEGVKTRLDSSRSVEELLGMVEVTSYVGNNLLQIDAVSADPEEAAQVANAFAQQFVLVRQDADRGIVATARELVKQKLDSLSPIDASSEYGLMLKEKYENLQILESMQTGGFTQVQTAFAPSAPFSPRPLRAGVLSLVAGLVIGVGLALLLDNLDKRVKDVKGLEQITGLPVLASIPAAGGRWQGRKSGNRSGAPVGFRSDPDMLESFRTLRSSLQYFDVERSIWTILVTSGLPREGKTTTTVNLALSLALTGNRVVIVEADLRQPMIPSYLGLRNEVGLSSVLASAVSIDGALQRVDLSKLVPAGVRGGSPQASALSPEDNLMCLASGPLPPNPAELLSSGQLEKVLMELRAKITADYVVIDTPPLLAVSDALILAPKVDAVIVTTRINWTTREEAHEVSSQLRRTGARVIGAVVTGEKARSGHYGRRGSYHYGYR